MKSRWMTCNETRYFYLDYANFGGDVAGLLAEVNAVHHVVLQQPLGSLLELVDVRGTDVSTEFLNLLKVNAILARPHLRKVAVVGVTGLRRTFAEMVARFSGQELTLFEDEEAAKEWLVRNDEK